MSPRSFLLPLVLAVTLLAPGLVSAAPRTLSFWFYSSVTSTIAGPIRLLAELNYDDARAHAPIAVVMPGFSPSSGNLEDVRSQARRLRDAGFFSVSVAMRGRDGSSGVRDSGGLEVHDIYDAVEAVKEEFVDLVDPTNVHITGYSGGGGNVMSALVRFPDYFRLGLSYFGMSDYGFDPIDGWYNNGAGSRTSILDQDVGNPNAGDPLVLDRYLARASNLAAANSRPAEVHLFVNDDESICPPVNHQTFAQIGGSHVVSHVGRTASPEYEDFNGNGVEDSGERQLWPHGFPSAPQQAAAEQWYRDRLLSGEIPVAELESVGTLFVAGFVKTRPFEIWIGDGQNGAGRLSYSLQPSQISLSTDILSSDESITMSVVVNTGFTPLAGNLVVVRLNGQLIDTFPVGARRIFEDIADGDVLALSSATVVPSSPSGLWPLALCLTLLVFVGVRRVNGSAL